MDTTNLVTELERSVFEARVDLPALRRELDAASAEADRRAAELDALDAAGAGRSLRLAAFTLLWMLPIALSILGVAS